MKPVCRRCFQRNVRKTFMCQYPTLLPGLVVTSNACAAPDREGCASLKLMTVCWLAANVHVPCELCD